MPPLPPYPNVLRVDHNMKVGDDLTALVRWHLTYTGSAPSSATCNTIAQDIASAFSTDILPLLPSTNSLETIFVQDLTTATAGEGSFFSGAAGTRSGTAVPADVCVLVNMPIHRRYRGGKPRSYWPFGVTTDVLDPQHWSGAFLTAVNGGLEAYLTALEAISVAGTAIASLVSISYYEGFTAVTNPITGRTRDVPKVRTVAIAPDIVGALNPAALFGSQRRRVRPR